MPYTLQDLPLLAELPPPVLAGLSALARYRRYPAGQILCTEGDPADQLIVLLAGEVVESVRGVDGTEVVLAGYGAPAGIGKVALLGSGTHPTAVTARTAVEVAYLPRGPLLAAVTGHPDSAARLLAALARMVRERDQNRVEAALLSAPTRVAGWLARRLEAGSTTVRLPAGQAGLAAELGLSRVTVNRALRSLRARGLISISAARHPCTRRGRAGPAGR
ncbi:MAG: Crp/Fnr family transcriptional regulator [Micromonosporaceae bacterium]|nr:Crp/Fnr family transcriptional regulator [Micromonosporaceae bacterium]